MRNNKYSFKLLKYGVMCFIKKRLAYLFIFMLYMSININILKKVGLCYYYEIKKINIFYIWGKIFVFIFFFIVREKW